LATVENGDEEEIPIMDGDVENRRLRSIDRREWGFFFFFLKIGLVEFVASD
jgi:hypothetical protein